MGWSLRDWITEVEEANALHRITDEVDWDEEMAGIAYLSNRQSSSPTLLFEDVRGSPDGYRVLFNLFTTSTARVAITLNEDPETTKAELIKLYKERINTEVTPDFVDASGAPVYENTDSGEAVDLTRFPAPKQFPKDGGRYIGTATAVISRDPETGDINVGTYRQMIHDERQTGMYTSPGKDLGLHIRKQWERDEPLDVAAVYGIPPEIFITSAMKYPQEVNEYYMAGGVADEPVELTEGEVTGLPIPAKAEIVAEGKIKPGDMKEEGPFGEYSGYYGRPGEEAPVFSVDAIHYRDDPILTSSIAGEDSTLTASLGRSARAWNDLENIGLPGVEGIHVYRSGGSSYTAIAIEKQYAGHASQAVCLAAQCPGNAYNTKVIIVVDDDVDPTKTDEVMWALATRFNPDDDVDILTDTWSTSLDPSQNPPEEREYASKMLIDATKHKDYDKYTERIAIEEDVYESIADKWTGLGFTESTPNVSVFAHETSGAIDRAGAADSSSDEEPTFDSDSTM